MTFWFIRHKPSGHYLPEPAGRLGRGGSHVEPTAFNSQPPRVFTTERSAKSALTAWLRGKFVRSGSRDWETGIWEEDDLECIPVPSRKREEMEIIPATLDLP